ncbi:DUF3310 domain-containing protein [Caniella muris]|uniref:DUF3310 domain-containing protein n=1 Tax=Caniella muris TaxID=2941502 RepID=UPI00203AA4E0|nr:DUF3310 domain-containing protein [Caniella muris]
MDERIYDDVTRPGHYCHGGYECADVVEAVLADAGDRVGGAAAWWTGNALKYLFRWAFKGSTPAERVRDLSKAEECCRRAAGCYEHHVAARRRLADETLARAE